MDYSEIGKQMGEKLRVMDEKLERVTGSGGTTAYTSGETWRNNKQYLIDDTVKDANGVLWRATENNINKRPENNPDIWERIQSDEEHITAWSNDPVGFEYFIKNKRRHNSQNWECIKEHIKTAGNAPRQGSDLWKNI